jgi:3-Oxoacyl-[acyl-carrier-protein (ACP)] synthase III C terminal
MPRSWLRSTGAGTIAAAPTRRSRRQHRRRSPDLHRLRPKLRTTNSLKRNVDVGQQFTQISKPSIAIAAERCGVPVEKCHTVMEKYGYTGSACIPMALDDAIELGKVKRGDLVVMISSGLGNNQAAAALRMTV